MVVGENFWVDKQRDIVEDTLVVMTNERRGNVDPQDT